MSLLDLIVDWSGARWGEEPAPSDLAAAGDDVNAGAEGNTPIMRVVQQQLVHGVLLFTKAQHKLKLIAYVDWSATRWGCQPAPFSLAADDDDDVNVTCVLCDSNLFMQSSLKLIIYEDWPATRSGSKAVLSGLAAASEDGNAEAEKNTPNTHVIQQQLVHGVLLFSEVHHGLKLIVNLKLNKSISRGKIASFTDQTLTATTHTSDVPAHIPSTNWTHWSTTSSQQMMSCGHHQH